ncbi:MAG: type II toxin-antitoxin system RelE/ParE family toxin [bacterium]
MTYQVEIRPHALRELKKLPQDVQKRLVAKISDLAQDPRPTGSVNLNSPECFYRLRVGIYRFIYSREDNRWVVVIIHVAHRRDTYR